MEDSSEYYVQIFLFVATVFCYILLAVCLFYGVYYCCVRACILRTKRKRQDGEHQGGEEQQTEKQSYCRRVNLMSPFHKDDKIAIIVPQSNTSKNTPPTEKHVDVEDSRFSNSVISNALDERNPFVDKKYYDIFVA